MQRELVLVDSFCRNNEDCFAFEDEFERAGNANGPITLFEMVSDVGNSACRIIGGRFDEDGNATWTVTFISNILKPDAIGPLSFFDGFVDVVFWDVKFLGAFDRNS